MNRLSRYLSLIVAAGLLLAACSNAAPTQEAAMQEDAMTANEAMSTEAMATEAMMDKSDEAMSESGHNDNSMMEETPEDAMMDDDKMEDDMMATETPEAMMEDSSMMAPGWFATALTNAASGESFAIQDFEGKVILVENMAVWCSTCLRQQQQVKALHEALGEREDFISIGLGIDPNEDAALLKGYIESNGFDWIYAIAPAELSRELANSLGDQFLNPPSAPMFIIDRHGALHPLPFGVKSAEDLQKALEPFLNEAM